MSPATDAQLYPPVAQRPLGPDGSRDDHLRHVPPSRAWPTSAMTVLGHCQRGIDGSESMCHEDARPGRPLSRLAHPRDGGGRLSLPLRGRGGQRRPERSPPGPAGHASPGLARSGTASVERARSPAGAGPQLRFRGPPSSPGRTSSKSSLTGILSASATLNTLSRRGENAPVSMRLMLLRSMPHRSASAS